MKRHFFRLMAFMAAAAIVLASCEKTSTDETESGLKDDTEQNGDNPGGNTGGTNPGTTPGADYSASLNGSAYVPILVDAVSAAKIQNKVITNLSVDDQAIFLYVWENTYLGGEPDGLSFYGTLEKWTSLIVGTVGWSGAGWCISDKADVNPNFKPVPGFLSSMNEAKDWYFHFGYKNIRNIPQLMTVIWGGMEYKFAYGADYNEYNESGAFVKTHKAIAPTSGAFQIGVWNEYEINLLDMGIDFTKETIGNYLVVNTEPTSGNTLDLDAVFFYKK